MKGFTLIEVLAALAILSVSLLGIAGMVAVGIRENGRAERTLEALQTAGERMERLRDGMGPSSGDEVNPRGIRSVWTILENTPESGLVTLEVTVSWNSWEDPERPSSLVLRRLDVP